MNSIFTNYRIPTPLSSQPQTLSLTLQIQTIHLVAVAALALLAFLTGLISKRYAAKGLPPAPSSASSSSLAVPTDFKTPGKTPGKKPKKPRVSFGGTNNITQSTRLTVTEETLDHKWVASLSENDEKIESIKIQKCKKIDPNIFQAPAFAALKELTIDRSMRALTDDVLKAIPKTVEKLQLKSGTSLTEEGFQALKEMQALDELSLEGCLGFTDDAAKFLPPSLRDLDLTRCHGITQKALASIPEGIEKLNLSDCFGIFSLEDLQVIPKTLSLGGCSSLVSSLPEFLRRAKRLESLDLTDCVGIEDQHLSFFPKSLRQLTLHGCSTLSKAFIEQMEARFGQKWEVQKTPYRKPKDSVNR